MRAHPHKRLSFLILVAMNVIVFFALLSIRVDDTLTVSFLDVGQGDSIFIEAPNGRQMLIDGGRDASVIAGLGRSMGFFDRSIDVVLATHPDQDHIGGLPLVFEKYDVANFVDSVAESDTAVYRELLMRGRLESSNYFLGMRGQIIVLDQDAGVYFHILYPIPDDGAEDETNELSIIGKLVYGDTSFMLTGDAGVVPEGKLVASDGAYLKSSVLKAGHHGSRTSSSGLFVRAVDPKYAVISAGRDNSYGHPHKEVMETLKEEGIEIISTAEEGTITFESNGVDVWLHK